MAKCAFIGLGTMGFPMASHLAAAGHDVVVFNRTPARADAWAAVHQGQVAATPAQAAENADLVFTCVGNDGDVRAVVLGPDGIVKTLRTGAIVVDHTTASAGLARHLDAELASHGAGFVDAPVSGGQAGAENGQLVAMCGGALDAFDTVRPVIGAYSRAAEHFGPAGSGQLVKMVNQICIAGLVEGIAEALNFAICAGLDADRAARLIAGGAAGSWQLQNRASTMIAQEFDFGFAVDWMRKDLAIALEEGRRIGANLPVTALVDQLYGEVQAMGGGRWDTSSLIARLRPKGERQGQ